MPELPEVETIRRELASVIKNKLISGVVVLLPRQIVGLDSSSFVDRLTGKKIVDIKRSGKYLLFELDDDQNLVIHLRMTGRLLFFQKMEENLPYCRVKFRFADNSCLCFCDVRTFGTVQLLKREELFKIKGLNELGAEPLTKAFSWQYLADKLQGSSRRIKNVLLDQRVIAGLGNIYVDESLFLSEIKPERQASTLSVQEMKKLHKVINDVLALAIESKGTTFRDYRTANGSSGSNQYNLWVYGRRGEKCKKCGSLLLYKKLSGRGTHYCPACQK